MKLSPWETSTKHDGGTGVVTCIGKRCEAAVEVSDEHALAAKERASELVAGPTYAGSRSTRLLKGGAEIDK